MDYRLLREKAGYTLEQMAEMTGYSVSTINGLELKDEGSERLRDAVDDVLRHAGPAVQIGQRLVPGSQAELAKWKERAIKAERKLHNLRSTMRRALDESAELVFSEEEKRKKAKLEGRGLTEDVSEIALGSVDVAEQMRHPRGGREYPPKHKAASPSDSKSPPGGDVHKGKEGGSGDQ
jgi:transcriptional regulator with XRE-family HTH domain